MGMRIERRRVTIYIEVSLVRKRKKEIERVCHVASASLDVQNQITNNKKNNILNLY